MTMGMWVHPCKRIIPDRGHVSSFLTIKTLSGIANSYTDNILVRTAHLTLKEGRKQVLVVRETPLYLGHIRLMIDAANIGAHILPPIPFFYHQLETIQDIIHQTIGKIFDYLQITHDLFHRWEGA